MSNRFTMSFQLIRLPATIRPAAIGLNNNIYYYILYSMFLHNIILRTNIITPLEEYFTSVTECSDDIVNISCLYSNTHLGVSRKRKGFRLHTFYARTVV